MLGKLDSSISFSVRPLSAVALQRRNIFDPDSSQPTDHSFIWQKEGKGRFQLLPLTFAGQYTSSYPYGWNDGAMIPNRGFQTYFSAGIYAEYKFISLQLQPEIVLAQNRAYEAFDSNDALAWQNWWWFNNSIDVPERFGDGSYHKVYWGQSSFRFNYKALSLGLSSENIWWGPARRNSLLMGNTAPGFLHITLNTRKPIRTWIGSFEGQLASGRLEASGFTPRDFSTPKSFDGLYRPKPDDWRYFQGITVSYQPKWVPGLSLGLSRSYIIEHRNIPDGIKNYFPVFGGLSKSSSIDPETGVIRADDVANDSYVSLYARWVIPDAKAEIYGEFGRDDAQWDFRDLMVQPEHTRAYTIGFRKLIDFDYLRKGDLLQVGMEVTQLENPKTAGLRIAQPWYLHTRVRHGYTHLGQVLGAGIGSGSNVQQVDVSWIRGLKQLGVQVERLVHNNDLFYNDWSGQSIDDLRRNWVDMSLAFHGTWDYNNFLFNARLQTIKAYNYQYGIEVSDPDLFWNFKAQDKWNLQMQIGASYRF